MRMWTVYLLIDPRADKVFYVGCSINPKRRLGNHMSDPASAAYWRCRDILNAGLRPQIKETETYVERKPALEHERRLITSLEGLVNLETSLGCAPGCLCGKHDRTQFTGNPNYAAEFAAKAELRKSRVQTQG